MKDETFPPINGNEIQTGSFQVTCHAEDTLEETQEVILNALSSAYKGETAHKIVRITYQRGQKSFIFNAGFEKEMYNDIVEWIEEVYKREYHPLVFQFKTFISYNPPEVV